MGFAPNQCAVIEDSEVGVEADVLAGMQVFHFSAHTEAMKNPHVIPFYEMSQLPKLLARFEEGAQRSLPTDVLAAASRRQRRD